MSNVYVHFSQISFLARYSVVNFQLVSHSLRFREVISIIGKKSLWNEPVVDLGRFNQQLMSSMPLLIASLLAVLGRLSLQFSFMLSNSIYILDYKLFACYVQCIFINSLYMGTQFWEGTFFNMPCGMPSLCRSCLSAQTIEPSSPYTYLLKWQNP